MENPRPETVLSVTAIGISIFGFFAPSIKDIRKAANDETTQDEVRFGVVAGATAIITLGAIYTAMTKRSGPLIVASIFALIMWMLYYSQLGDAAGTPTWPWKFGAPR